MLSYDGTLSRVRIDLTAVRTAIGADDTGLVERSLDQVRWITVRGGVAVSITAAALDLDDYEFSPDVVSYYRVTPTSGVYTDSITPSLAGMVWLKNLRFPFLNQAVYPSDASDVTRRSLGGTFDVIGRSYPVAVTVMRASAQFDLTVATGTADDRNLLIAAVSTGDVILLQNPPGSGYQFGGGYYAVGDVTETRQGVAWDRRWITLPLTAVAAPGADVVGVTITWAGVVADYATWSGLCAARAPWAYSPPPVGGPAGVIVGCRGARQ